MRCVGEEMEKLQTRAWRAIWGRADGRKQMGGGIERKADKIVSTQQRRAEEQSNFEAGRVRLFTWTHNEERDREHAGLRREVCGGRSRRRRGAGRAD